MMLVVHKLPSGVKLSPGLRERASFYLLVTHFGIPFYIAATPKVRQLLRLDSKGKDAKPDRRLRWSGFEKADALRDIVSSLELQVRDVILAGIAEDVKQELLKRMNDLMSPTVNRMVEERATKANPLLMNGTE